MLLIVGLGNIGKQYSNTRHNVGFMAADIISSRLSFSSFSESNKFKSTISSGDSFNEKIIIAKPSTYMNLSGEAVLAISHYYKIPSNKVIVIHDDIDLKLGDARIKLGGGNGGHNGLKSIDAHIGKDYWRVRIGVGRPLHSEDVADYVLTDFSKNDKMTVDEVLHEMINHIISQKFCLGDKANSHLGLTNSHPELDSGSHQNS